MNKEDIIFIIRKYLLISVFLSLTLGVLSENVFFKIASWVFIFQFVKDYVENLIIAKNLGVKKEKPLD